MNNSNYYMTPKINVMEIDIEGVLCGSNEVVGDNEGEW